MEATELMQKFVEISIWKEFSTRGTPLLTKRLMQNIQHSAANSHRFDFAARHTAVAVVRGWGQEQNYFVQRKKKLVKFHFTTTAKQ